MPILVINEEFGQIENLIENETLVDTVFPEMIETATEIAEQLKLEAIDAGLHRMNQTLDYES